jgi:hypothetical protein
MNHRVTSRFSITSPPRLGTEWLSERFPWTVTESRAPDDKVPYHITGFDLAAGEHDRVDSHLTVVKRILLKSEQELSNLSEECSYALWLNYNFPRDSGSINFPVSLQSAFSFMRVEIILRLSPH